MWILREVCERNVCVIYSLTGFYSVVYSWLDPSFLICYYPIPYYSITDINEPATLGCYLLLLSQASLRGALCLSHNW